jgi:hypothetical protein
MTEQNLNTDTENLAKPLLANRLLKFRGRKPNSKNWEFFDMNDYFLNDNGSFPLFLEYKMINICQFTGLIDKNGTEIYEGDILKGKNNKVFICEFIGAGFKFSQRKGLNVYSATSTHYLTKIGNLFDNPELLQTTS